MSSPWLSLLSAFPLAATSNNTVLSNLSEEANADTAVVPLVSMGVIRVVGPDASKFLQGQASTDFREVTDKQSRLGCFVNLKGRVIASYRAIQQGEQIELLLDQELANPVKDRLAKFIVFSKATISVDDSRIALGLYGKEASSLLVKHGLPAPENANDVAHHNNTTVVRLVGDNRFLLIGATDAITQYWNAFTAEAKPCGENAWLLHAIRAGEPHVVAASTETFQPQELNYHVLSGVSYNKGCYTGQEIVARLYFRGKLKQQTARFSLKSDTVPSPNTPLFADGKHVADVVQAAFKEDKKIELLAIARPEHFDTLSLADAEVLLTHLPLPYDVPSPE